MNGNDHARLLQIDAEGLRRSDQRGLLGRCQRLLAGWGVTRTIPCLLRRIGLRNRDFTIISDNCWGGFVYQRYGLRYRSPFVGLFLFPSCYVELLENFQRSMASELAFIDAGASRYRQVRAGAGTTGVHPIGVLNGSIEIHFLHYRSADEARAKWIERKQRINLDNALFKMSDRLEPAADLIQRFDALPSRHKLFLAARPHPIPCARSPRELDLKAFLNGMLPSARRDGSPGSGGLG